MATNLYETITNRILADMEAGTMPWEKSWDGSKRGSIGIPSNASTKRPYRGINVLILWAASQRFGGLDMRFVTYKQAKDCGGTVKKGEHGTQIVFYKPLTVQDKNDADKERTIPLLRAFTVFHVSQTEGCDFSAIDAEAPELPSDASEFAESLRLKLTHGGDRACYIPSQDQILMPFPQDFKTIDAYRATLYHEVTHWTGAKRRLDRNIMNKFGTMDYAQEELVAELGGAFLCAEYGIEYTTQHASYLASWIKKLQDDKRAIFKAASDAQKAADLIRSIILAEETEPEMAEAA